MAISGQGIGYTGENNLEEYISNHIDPEGYLLEALYRETHLKKLNPRMASGHIQGRLLKMIVSMIEPMSILEVGTFTGYATLCMAEALPDGGVIHTFEIDDELEDFTKSWLARSPYRDKIILHIGDVLKTAPMPETAFDMVYIDGEKREYPDYYDKLFCYVKPGGFIVADNTLWDGHVFNPDYNDDRTAAIRRFNDMVAADDRTEVAMVPVRDGFSIIKKIKD